MSCSPYLCLSYIFVLLGTGLHVTVLLKKKQHKTVIAYSSTRGRTGLLEALILKQINDILSFVSITVVWSMNVANISEGEVRKALRKDT